MPRAPPVYVIVNCKASSLHGGAKRPATAQVWPGGALELLRILVALQIRLCVPVLVNVCDSEILSGQTCTGGTCNQGRWISKARLSLASSAKEFHEQLMCEESQEITHRAALTWLQCA